MASPAPDEQSSRVRGGQKRKREPDDHDARTDERQFADAAEDEASFMNPDDDDHETDNDNDNDNGSTYTPDDEDEEDQEPDDDDDGYESFSEENANIAIYDESQEPFPACVVYDSGIEDIKKRLKLIPKEVLQILPEDSVKSKSLSMHIAKAKENTEFPKTTGIKIAILGSAGAGKSSLLNAVTNIPDLAKSMSGGQSCTSVPMVYCGGTTTRQPKTYAAGLQYLQPDGIRRQISEMIKDYSTFAFDLDPDWDEDEKITARTVHFNAEAMLRTMFSNLPGFKTKPAMKKTLQQHHSLRQREPPESSLLDELVQVCEEKLKETSKYSYIKQFSADTPTQLKALIDPYLTTPRKFSKPVFWPLIHHVRIGVRGSRVLDSVTLIDLPGISDTNEARVELTHDFIKSCDYIWVVAPLERIADDSTVNQLFSRYAKSFRGNICVICTHTDDGVTGDEDNLIDFISENLEGHEHLLTTCSEFKEEIARKSTDINRLVRKSKTTKEPRQSTIRTTTTQQTGQVSLADLQKYRRASRSKLFAHIVLARNALITQQLIENLGRHMPEGSELHVHCVSSLHYAALKGREVHGPRLSAEHTGIPRLRAQVLTLAIPRLQETLEHYMNYTIPLNLKSFQAWLNGTAVDCRSELLNLVRQPQEDLEFFVGKRLAAFQKESVDRMQKVLEASLPEAKEAASRHVAKKRDKFGATIMAFVRKNGKHSTRVCPKECWNEGFLRCFAEVVKECQHSLSEARQDLNEDCKQTAIQRLDSLVSSVEAHPASFPKGTILSQIETCKFGIGNTFTESERNYAKGTRNLVIDATQDREKNIFSCSMQSIYQECNNESDRKRISSRSLDRLEAHLTQDGPKNPFAVASRNLTRGILQVDKTDILEHVQTSISEIFNRLYISMDELLDDTQVDDAEAEARNQMKEVLPAQHAGLKAICQDYAALKTKYENSD